MIAEEKNRIIAEGLGLCWHDWEKSIYEGPPDEWGRTFPIKSERCKNCNSLSLTQIEDNPDFSTWPGFGVIMERGPGRKWWESFFAWLWEAFNTQIDFYLFGVLPISHINPPIMQDKLATWLAEHEGEWREK